MNELFLLEREIVRIDDAIRLASCAAEKERLEACDSDQQMLSAPASGLWCSCGLLIVGIFVALCLLRFVLVRFSRSWSVRRVRLTMDKRLRTDTSYRLAAAVGRKSRNTRLVLAGTKSCLAAAIVLLYIAVVVSMSKIYSELQKSPNLPSLLQAALSLPQLVIGFHAAAAAASQYLVFSCGLPVLTSAFFLLSSACDDLRRPSSHGEGSPYLTMVRRILAPPDEGQ